MPHVEDLLTELVDREPALRPTLISHLEDNYGELLSTIFMAEVIDWVVEHHGDAPDVGARVFQWMNEKYEAASDELKDVLATGGVEAIPVPGKPGAELRESLSPALQAVDPWNKTWHRSRSSAPPDA